MATSSAFQIPAQVLDDLCSRFIINIPKEEQENLIRIFFQIELAHWFYLDFYCPSESATGQLKICGIKEFSKQIFAHCPSLAEHADNVDNILGSWKEYKMTVPTYGAILLDPTYQYCVLVQGFWSKASWGFPKGKVNEEESPVDCAVREVLEETGFSCASLILPSEYLEYKINEQISRLYIVPNVPKDTVFQPKTRNEIKKIEWFKIDQLPTNKKDPNCKINFGVNPNAFFMVIPFVKQLKRWIPQWLNKSQMDLNGSGHFRGREKRSKSFCQDDQRLFNDHSRPKRQGGQGWNEYQEFPKSKDSPPKGKGYKDQRTETESPPHKQIQILQRDGTASGHSKKGPHSSRETWWFAEGDAQKQKKMTKGAKAPFHADAWVNFKFDVDSIMRSFTSPS